MSIPIRPRNHGLAKNCEVMPIVKAMMSEPDYVVDWDKEAGTVCAQYDGTPIYRAMQKGSGEAPWIVTYSTEYFG